MRRTRSRAGTALPLAPAPHRLSAMAHRFQSFDDHSDRTATPSRLAALRAELARCGLEGFIITRTDRHQSEYVPASEERLAWLTAFTGSAGRRHRAYRARGRIRRRALYPAGGRAGRWLPVRNRPSGRASARQVDRGQCGDRHPPRLRPLACDRRRRRAPRQGPAPRWAGLWLASRPTRWTPSGPTARPSRSRPSFSTTRNTRVNRQAPSSRVSRPKSASSRSTASWSPIRTDCAGCSTSVAGDVAHTPIALGFALVPKDGRPLLHMDGRKLGNSVRAALSGIAELARAARLRRRPRRVRGRTYAQARPGDRCRRPRPPDHRLRRQGGARQRPHHGHEGGEERRRDRRHPHGPSPRRARRSRASWPGSTAPPPAARSPKSPPPRRWRIFAQRPASSRTSRFRASPVPAPNGAIVHYRVNRQTNRAIHPGELFLIDSGAQYEDGTTDVTRTIAVGTPHRGDARTLHPRPQGPHRHRARGLSGRHHRRPARQFRARARCGRRASISTTGPATASAAICRCTRVRRAFPSSATRRSQPA